MITNYMTVGKRITARIKITAKTLWVSLRSGPDLQLSMGFYCPRVKFSGEQNWKKMKHLEQNIWKTRFVPLFIAITDEGAIICIDSGHAAHTDYGTHSIMVSTICKVALRSLSEKPAIVVNTPTETDFHHYKRV